VPAIVLEDLRKLKETNGEGFLFSRNEGARPIKSDLAVASLYKALEYIGIDAAERHRRGLTFHSWRHFFNTTLRMANVPDCKVQAVTGHDTKAMTDWYTHFNNTELVEVLNVQQNLFISAPAPAPEAPQTTASVPPQTTVPVAPQATAQDAEQAG
jgi:integrase